MTAIRRSTFDESVARLRTKFSNPRDAAEAVRAFSEGWEVLPDTDPYFASLTWDQVNDMIVHQVMREAGLDATPPDVPTTPATTLAASAHDIDLRQRAARIIEATGVTEVEAMARARRAIAVETGEAYVATQADIDLMSSAELMDYVKAGGALPEDAPEDLNPMLGKRDLTEQEVADMLVQYDAEHEGGVLARKHKADVQQAREAQAKRLGEVHGYTPEQAERAVAGMTEEQLGFAAPTPSAAKAERDALIAQMRATPPEEAGFRSSGS
ncbi:MAG TPA: hypothetical protein VJ850_09015 [Candidatus Limnocylindrales bacterium]|nr:hypothetical protein [Candidatus Limnocylindrales bacterium]